MGEVSRAPTSRGSMGSVSLGPGRMTDAPERMARRVCSSLSMVSLEALGGW